jgi:hypothetical protein
MVFHPGQQPKAKSMGGLAFSPAPTLIARAEPH